MSRAVIQVIYSELSKTLYHGSDRFFTKIDLSYSAPKKDFGCGFYTTTDKHQAEKFAKLKARRSKSSKGFVALFELESFEGLVIKQFGSADERWFDFVLGNRGHELLAQKSERQLYDIVIGPVANDAVGLVLNQFISGVYGDPSTSEAKATAIRLLMAQTLHNQVFFGTELAISCLKFLEVYDVQLD